ncbi:MAG: bifunctional aspartate kinase/homoserine dehydrogenase I [Saprospiraceae bacterium]|nr:bifunctional aspartate kinase/homoserine dehydrogenase I [Saprospiraceae bacterium]
MKVLKFGGSSVKNAENINKVLDILEDKLANNEQFAVVCSALGGITDLLIKMSELAASGKDEYIAYYHQFKDRHESTAKQLLGDEHYMKIAEELDQNYIVLKDLLKGIFLVREVSLRTMDYVLSFGERNSNFIIAQALKKRGVGADYLDARRIVITNKEFSAAKVNFELTNEKIQNHFNSNSNIQVVTGFIASDLGGLTTTLGRGGSDYTAAILAGALDATELEIWTDVDGVLTSDPRTVKKAFTVDKLSYAEAMEMSHFGAKVIYPPTILPAMSKSIPIFIKNTFNPTHSGTKIHIDTDEDFRSPIKGISALSNIALMNLEGSGMMGTPGISGRLFSTLAQGKINVILITQASSEHSISFAISENDAERAKELVEKEFQKEIESNNIAPIDVDRDQVIIAVIGEKMKAVPGVAGNLFNSLGKNGINVAAIAQGSSELNISFVIDKDDQSKAMNLIHDSFFLSEQKSINIFSIGVGLIGGTLLTQIEDQKDYLKNDLSLELKIAGLSNSRKMLFDEGGIDAVDWREKMEESELKADIQSFVHHMITMNLPNTIFIDNTASGDVPAYYKEILEASISIVTPNKIATSSSYAHYLDLKNTAKRNNVQFLYETNVGAGLPVINTLQGLINSGDRIEKIEAVVSGSLSYIFNNFDGSVAFSDLVQEAKQLGYTEPDPRDDLSGSDVRRKIIILTREAGIAIEPEDVELSPILPKSCIEADGIDAFFVALETENEYFNTLINKAKNEGKVLRFIASTQNGKAKISLQAVGPENPFFSLQMSDNMIVFTTKRYNKRPLIVRGPGAGAEVTAGGVFSDIITIGK